MNLICNDVLTRKAELPPPWQHDPTGLKTVFRVGDKGDKNGMPYTIKAFGTYIKWRGGVPQIGPDRPTVVYLVIKYRGARAHKWDCLIIGDTRTFQERIILGGRHPNPIFDQVWPKDRPQPFA